MSPALALLLAAAVETTPICTDRPAKANAVCTVPAGTFQLESSLDRLDLGEAWRNARRPRNSRRVGAKPGLSARSDVQLGFTPYARLTASEYGQRSRASGFGDLTARYKQRLTAASSPLQVGAIAFVKLPTAVHGLGNRKVEGGLAIPASFAAGGPLTLTLGPELDLLADAEGKGRHLALANVVNLSAPVAPRLTIAGELWTNLNFDPAGTVKQASADAALAYALSNDVQLDAGANLGLTRDTPDIELYAGASLRFGRARRR